MAKPQLHMKFQPNRTRNKKVVTDLKSHIFPPDHTLEPDFLWDVDHINKSSSDLAENRCVVQAHAWDGTHQSSDTSGQVWKSQGTFKTRFLPWSQSCRKHYKPETDETSFRRSETRPRPWPCLNRDRYRYRDFGYCPNRDRVRDRDHEIGPRPRLLPRHYLIRLLSKGTKIGPSL